MNEIAENPYSAPEADLKSSSQANVLNIFTRFSTWAVVGLSIITMGIYAVYWLYSRSKAINSVIDNKIPSALITTSLVLYVLGMIINYGPFLLGSAVVDILPAMMIASPIIGLASFVAMIIWVFKFRNRLNEMTQSEGKPTWAGPILTFFFQVLYLNYKINQHIDVHNSK